MSAVACSANLSPSNAAARLSRFSRGYRRRLSAAVRNRIAHAYFGIDDTILFATIAEEVKELLPRMEALARQHDVKI
jgi:uncharacterized protein YutE (UPF0331/DUF86 family)